MRKILSSLAANPRLQKHSGRERVRPDELVRTGIQGFGDPYTIPVRLARRDEPFGRASAGRALYYEANTFLRNLLPAEDLKYFSLAIESFRFANSSK